MKAITLPSVVDYTKVVDLHRMFLNMVDEQSEIILDCSAIERVDGVGLQLIAALARTSTARGVHFTIESPSWPFLEAARILDLEKAFNFR